MRVRETADALRQRCAKAQSRRAAEPRRRGGVEAKGVEAWQSGGVEVQTCQKIGGWYCNLRSAQNFR